MDALKSGNSLSMIVFVVIALVVLYYAYQFLYSPSDLIGNVVLPKISPANTDTPYEVSSKTSGRSGQQPLPEIYEGGEYSINTWVYINDYAINRGQNKHILNLGGSSFSTLAIFLGAYKNSLAVRVQTSTPSSNNSYNGSQDNLSTSSLQTMFTTLQSDSSLLNSSKPFLLHQT